MIWRVVTKFDPGCCLLADRHYSRRKVGAPQFMPPGETLVLADEARTALFGWWRPHPASGLKSMNGLDGWTCTIFRNEGKVLSSELVIAAEEMLLAAGRAPMGWDGLITYVFDGKVKSSNPGYCFKQAGWVVRGRSRDGKKTLLQKPRDRAGLWPERIAA